MDARLNENAQAELAALRERVAGITSTLPDVVWSVEVPSNKIVYVSPAVEAVFGKTADQTCGPLSGWSDLIHPDDRERVLADWNQALRRAHRDGVQRHHAAGRGAQDRDPGPARAGRHGRCDPHRRRGAGRHRAART